MVAKYIYASTEILSAVLSFVAAAYLFLTSSYIKKQYRALGAIELLVGILLFCDGIAWYFNGTPGRSAYYLNIFGNFMTFSLIAILPVLYCLYIVQSMSVEGRGKGLLRGIVAISAATLLFHVISRVKSLFLLKKSLSTPRFISTSKRSDSMEDSMWNTG